MVFRNPYPDISIPDMPLTSFALQKAEQLGDKPAFIDGPSSRGLTYGQLAAIVRRMAAGLAQRGFQKGDMFAIYSSNLPEYAVAFHAVAALGGVITPVSPLASAES